MKLMSRVEYFTCPPKCGVFILAARLSAPTTTYPSRPASVASHMSHASHSSVASGRMTPAHERIRPTTATPGKSRTVSVSTNRFTPRTTNTGVGPDEETGRPLRALLGVSTSTNTTPGKITAGSRASKYVGMTAKQLQSAREGTLGASVRGTSGLDKSTATTPKAARGPPGTPATIGRPRQSMGGSMITPRAKPRGSIAQSALSYGERENMPPPPSPGKTRIGSNSAQANMANLEAEIRELQARNTELESELATAIAVSEAATAATARAGSEEPSADLETLRNEIEAATNQADELKHHLAQVQEDARQATDLAEELLDREKAVDLELEAVKKEVGDLRLEKGEVEAGLEAKKDEVKQLESRLKEVEGELGDAEGNVEELRAAGQVS